MAPAELLQVEVVYSAHSGHMDVVPLLLSPGSTLVEALKSSGLLEQHGLHMDQLRVGIWGKASEMTAVLRARDRVEIYRPLLVDPKEARRQRYRKDRPGRKPLAA